jgi:hypothetical protein
MFSLTMTKWTANSTQDAMGFGYSIRNAHSHYMVRGVSHPRFRIVTETWRRGFFSA